MCASNSVTLFAWLSRYLVLTATTATIATFGFCTTLLLHTFPLSAQESGGKIASKAEVRSQPLSPDESAKLLVLADTHQIKLIAVEPNVASPVDAAFDDAGRLWVVEMIDYPFPANPNQKPRGRIKILNDKNLDGTFETAVVFADELDMPNGIAHWKDGVVVTVAGQLEWMRDTDGDNRVDERIVWLEGFTKQNEQLRANHPRLELDGKWYIASGLRGGKVKVADGLSPTPQKEPIELGTRDIRFDPRTGQAEAITGPAQFGLTSDLVGSRMFCSNRNPCVQVVFEQSHLQDNPLVGVVPAVIDVLAAGEASKVYPLVDAWTTSNLHAGQFTAACGVHFQHVPAHKSMPADMVKQISQQTLGTVYVCEPTGSLVRRQTVMHTGNAWTAVENEKEKDQENGSASASNAEWLASRDPWFRAVNVVSAPGGGNLVIDMHRAVIEHPAFVPDELKARPDQRYGEMAGRIYWTAEKSNDWPADLLKQLSDRRLRDYKDDELVALLAHTDGWMRRTAARLLIERDAVGVVPKLRQLATPADDHSVETRIIALQLLALFDPAARANLLQYVTDSHRLIQIAAIRQLARLPVEAEGVENSKSAETTKTVLDLAIATEDPWIRLEAILCASRGAASLTEADGQQVADRLGRLAASHLDDAQLLLAIGGATRLHSSRFLLSWLDGLSEIETNSSIAQVGQLPVRDKYVTTATRLLVSKLEKQDKSQVSELLARARFNLTSPDPKSEVSRLAVLTALTQHARANPKQKLPKSNDTADVENATLSIDRAMWRKIRELARLDEYSLPVRLAAVELLGLSPRNSDQEFIAKLAQESSDGAMRNVAIRAWVESGAEQSELFLVDQLVQASPSLRPTLLELLLSKPSRHAALAKAISDGRMTAKQLGAVELKKFADRAQGETKVAFQKQLDSIMNSDRAAVLKNYESCLSLVGNEARGKQVFAKQCAACHRIGDVGVQVGPDISDSRVQTPEKLLTSILDPNRAIDNSYFRFVILTTDGRTLDGLIAEETSDKLVIRSQNDQRHVVSRSDIDQLKPTGISMMPEGLESQVDQQAMADLIAFIKNWRYANDQIPAGTKAGPK